MTPPPSSFSPKRGGSATTPVNISSNGDSLVSNDHAPIDNGAKGSDDDIVNNIIIREYNVATDYDQVHILFRRGMESLIPNLTQNVVSQPLFCLPVLGLAWAAHWGVSKLLHASTRRPKMMSRSSSSSNAGSSSLLLWSHSLLPLVAAAVTAISSVALTHWASFALFQPYIQKSIDTDLSDIHGVYEQHGGCFLVAVDTATGKVVGTVAGEYKEPTDENGHAKGTGDVYELRRMSVDLDCQNKGLGKRLIQALEEKLRARGCQQIFLGCSSIQVAAHRLYGKSGFRLTQEIKPATLPLIYRNALKFYRFEKNLAEDLAKE